MPRIQSQTRQPVQTLELIVSDVATGGAAAVALDALTGSELPLLRRFGRFASSAGAAFFSGVASGVTRLLGSVSKPDFCK